jgi:NitT/TauT family transport system substrate-binding protein
MGDDLLAYGVRKMREYGIVAGGDARRTGLLHDDRRALADHGRVHQGAGLARASTDYAKAWSLEIVDNVKVTP